MGVWVGGKVCLQKLFPAVEGVPSVVDNLIGLVGKGVKRVSHQVVSLLLQIPIPQDELNGTVEISGEEPSVPADNTKSKLMMHDIISL
jgi:hypothetical protein